MREFRPVAGFWPHLSGEDPPDEAVLLCEEEEREIPRRRLASEDEA